MDEETRDKLNILYSLTTDIHQSNVQILKNQKEIMAALVDVAPAANQILCEAQVETDNILRIITGGKE